MYLKSESELECFLARLAKFKKTEFTLVNEYFFNKHNAARGHYRQNQVIVASWQSQGAFFRFRLYQYANQVDLIVVGAFHRWVSYQQMTP